jgi:hypothetical protein
MESVAEWTGNCIVRGFFRLVSHHSETNALQPDGWKITWNGTHNGRPARQAMQELHGVHFFAKLSTAAGAGFEEKGCLKYSWPTTTHRTFT